MSSLRNYNFEELVVGVGEKYKLVEKIGSGSFGHIYLATNISNQNEQVAVKVERKQQGHELLLNEHRVYSSVRGAGAPIPQMKWYGPDVRQGFDINIMVMELLGRSLEDYFDLCARRFTLKTTLMLTDQLLAAVEYLHGKSFIHRDIKAENFLMGLGSNCNKVFMIDFGFAKKYRDQRTRWHISKSRNNPLIGTARYCSIRTHEGVEQSRRDDLEALTYMLIYFLQGSLPWQGLKGANKKQRYNNIMECKISTSIEKLCKDIPKEFGMLLVYCRCLKFDELPDYKYLRQLFQTLFRRRGYLNDNKFDWTNLEEKDSKLDHPGPSTT